MKDGAFIAVDWGTTNRRVYHIDGKDAVIASEQDDRGILSIQAGGFTAEATAIRARFGDLPLVCAGMVGSQKGWAFAPYLPCPAGPADLAQSLYEVEPGRSFITYGVSDPRGDVMRGEEVQFIGAVAAGLASPNALLCQPGTHCKWAQMEQGCIATFSTAMTGEMFAMLGRDSLLADFLGGSVDDGPAFREGVIAAKDASLLDALFSVRAKAILGMREAEHAAAFTSGLLIGSDVWSRKLGAGQKVYLLAEGVLAKLYSVAIGQVGGETIVIDSQRAFVAGITHIWRHAS